MPTLTVDAPPAPDRPLRVALIAPPWLTVPPDGYGGTEEAVDGLARGLVAAGHDVVLAAREDSTCPVPRWAPARASGHDIGTREDEVGHVERAYRELPPVDVVHDQTMTGAAMVGSGTVRPPAPCVFTNHGPFDARANALYAPMRPPHAVVAISHAQCRAAEGVCVAAVIHHGIDVDAIEPGSGGDHLVHLARMAPYKGADIAIDAARRAGVPLVLAAKVREPAERDFFEARVRPKLGGDIEFFGEADWEQKLDLLRGARALINPIRWEEPFGLVMIESLAVGTPVLAFRRGAAPEIVDEGVTGRLVDSLDELVAAICSSGGLSRRACRAAATGRFSRARMVADHVALYRRLVVASVEEEKVGAGAGRSARPRTQGQRAV